MITSERSMAVLLFAALAGHAIGKGRAELSEMLYACHLATFVLALGLLVHRRALVATGFHFHATVGLPSYLANAISVGTTPLSSVVVHLLPVFSGAIALRGMGFPPATGRIAAASAGVMLLGLVLARLFTPPALNINLAFSPWPPLRRWLSSPWQGWLALGAVFVVAFALSERLFARLFPGSSEAIA